MRSKIIIDLSATYWMNARIRTINIDSELCTDGQVTLSAPYRFINGASTHNLFLFGRPYGIIIAWVVLYLGF